MFEEGVPVTSRREAVATQRETRLARMEHNLRGERFTIHPTTQAYLQCTLLDLLLDAEAAAKKFFSVSSRLLLRCCSAEDAAVYRDFFARCVSGIWNVELIHHDGEFSFTFAHI